MHTMYMIAPIDTQASSMLVWFDEDSVKVRGWYTLQVSLSDWHDQFRWAYTGDWSKLPQKCLKDEKYIHYNSPNQEYVMVVPLFEENQLKGFFKEKNTVNDERKSLIFGVERFTLEITILE